VTTPEEHSDPTPDEIEAACLEYQANWSPAQRRRASVTRPAPWLPPTGRVLRERPDADE